MSASYDPIAAEKELVLLLSGTRARRERSRERIRTLSDRVDPSALFSQLYLQKMLGLGAARLEEAAPGWAPLEFRQAIDESVERTRHRALMLEGITRRVTRRLEDAGIPVVPLKGPRLARALYGDEALRPSADIDLLVDPDDIHRAVPFVCADGYDEPPDPLLANGLPVIHYTFESADDTWRPHIDLHWRIHWFEDSFSRELVRRSSVDSSGMRVVPPAYALAALLVFYARDGFLALRYAADVAAWYDRHGAELPQRALDAIAEEHPKLRRALGVAAAVTDRLVGVPADRIISPHWAHGARGRLAARLVNWTQEGERRQLATNLTLVDWLLSPPSGLRDFAERNLVISREYGFDAENEGDGATGAARGRAATARYYAGGVARFLGRYARALWMVRPGHSLSPLPPDDPDG